MVQDPANHRGGYYRVIEDLDFTLCMGGAGGQQRAFHKGHDQRGRVLVDEEMTLSSTHEQFVAAKHACLPGQSSTVAGFG